MKSEIRLRVRPKTYAASPLPAGVGRAWALLLLLPLAVRDLTAQDQPGNPAGEAALKGLEELPAVVAEVDGRPIGRTELIRELVGSAAPEALQRIVQRMLVEQEAEKRGIQVSDQELAAQLALDRQRLPNDMHLVPRAPWDTGKETFESIVQARYRMTVEEYKVNVVRQRLLVKKMLGLTLQPSVVQLRTFFAEQQELFQPQETYRAAHILISPLSPYDLYRGTRLKSDAARAAELQEERRLRASWRKDHGVDMSEAPVLGEGPEWEQARQKALQCLADLKEGRLDWAEAVKRYTQDPHDLPSPKDGKTLRQRQQPPQGPGEVGTFTKLGPMVKEFYEGAKGIPAGEVGGPIRTKFGYHIVKMLSIHHPKRLTFEESRDQLERTYVEWVIRARSEAWLDDLLKAAGLESARGQLWPPGAGQTPQEQPGEDPLVGKVNGKPVYRSEVWRELLRSDGSAALDRLINREMALGPLQREGPKRLLWLARPQRLRTGECPQPDPLTVDPAEVDLELNADRLDLDRLNTERKKRDEKAKTLDLAQYLQERYGQSPEAYRRALEAGVVLSKAVRKMVDLDEATLQLEFALAKERYRAPASFLASHILIAVEAEADAGAWQDAQQMAHMVYEQLASKKKSWEELVVQVSDDKETREEGGTLGTLVEGSSLYPELYRALVEENYERGQITKPIRTRAGWHVIKIDGRQSSRIPEFKDIRQRLERDYLQARASMFLDVWLRSMQNQAKIQRHIFKVESLLPAESLPLPEH